MDENIARWEFNSDAKSLIKISHTAILKYGDNLLKVVPSDVRYYCPNYGNLNKQNRVEFWSGLLSSLSYFESEHSNHTVYKEKILDIHGKAVISRGLLQISKESANAYGCQIEDEKQLHNAKININCAVRIMDKWVGQKDKIIASRAGGLFVKPLWLGAARYWSPFRDHSKARHIAFVTRQISYCKR